MHKDNPSPRLAVLADLPARREFLVTLCRSTLPGARVEALRDMVDLMLRVAGESADAVVIDGDSPGCLPEEGATVLKGLRATLIVAVVDHDDTTPAPHCVDVLLEREQLPAWLAATFTEATRNAGQP